MIIDRIQTQESLLKFFWMLITLIYGIQTVSTLQFPQFTFGLICLGSIGAYLYLHKQKIKKNISLRKDKNEEDEHEQEIKETIETKMKQMSEEDKEIESIDEFVEEYMIEENGGDTDE